MAKNLPEPEHVRHRIFLEGFHAEGTAQVDHGSFMVHSGEATAVIDSLSTNDAGGSFIRVADCVFNAHRSFPLFAIFFGKPRERHI